VDGVLAVDALVPLFVVALPAPIVVGLAPRLPVPQVVLLLVGGILIGPDVLGLSSPGGGSSARTPDGGPFSPGSSPSDWRPPWSVSWPASVWCGRSCRWRSA
jgi:hypothetical protein